MHMIHVTQWLAVILILAAPQAVLAFQLETPPGTGKRGDRMGLSEKSGRTETASETTWRVGCTLREFLFKEIGLSQEQATEMRNVTAVSMQKIKRARVATRKINEEKVNMFLCGRVDRKRLEMLDSEYLKYHTQLVAERLKMQRERVAILTEEQVKRLGGFLATKTAEAGFRKASK